MQLIGIETIATGYLSDSSAETTVVCCHPSRLCFFDRRYSSVSGGGGGVGKPIEYKTVARAAAELRYLRYLGWEVPRGVGYDFRPALTERQIVWITFLRLVRASRIA